MCIRDSNSDLPVFAAAFDAEVRRFLVPEQISGVVYSDGEIPATELTLDLAEAIRAGGPWGQGFPEPVFDNAFEVLDSRVVGGHHLKLALRPLDGTGTMDAIAFNQAERAGKGLPGRLRVAYHVEVDEYRGAPRLQLRVAHLEPAA
jgi:single-stranded-DNA-specific exonuclease